MRSKPLNPYIHRLWRGGSKYNNKCLKISLFQIMRVITAEEQQYTNLVDNEALIIKG